MNTPFEVTRDDHNAIVKWATRTYQSLTKNSEVELEKLIEDYSVVIFDFSATRAVSTRWLRLVQRLTIRADQMAKELAVVGLSQPLLEKADLVAIKQSLHLYGSIAEVSDS